MDRILSYYMTGRVEGRALFATELRRIIAEGYIGDTATRDRIISLITDAENEWEEELRPE